PAGHEILTDMLDLLAQENYFGCLWVHVMFNFPFTPIISYRHTKTARRFGLFLYSISGDHQASTCNNGRSSRIHSTTPRDRSRVHSFRTCSLTSASALDQVAPCTFRMA